jgi:uncharacterized protein YegP (UPF0339 family)
MTMLKFEVYKAANEYYFRVTADTEPILLASEGDKQKENVLKNIEAVKKNAPVPSSIEKGETSDGDYFFTLSNSRGKIVCISAMFYSSLERDKWLNDIQKELPQLDIVES